MIVLWLLHTPGLHLGLRAADAPALLIPGAALLYLAIPHLAQRAVTRRHP